jgi:hypothetical protein
MRNLGLSLIAIATLHGVAAAQPGGSDMALPATVDQQAPTYDVNAMQDQTQQQPQGPQLPDPANAPTRATFVSTTNQQWDVFVDRVAICSTPCTLGLSGVNYVALKTQERDPVRLDIGYVPQGDVMVSGKPLREGLYAGGIVMTSFAGMALVTGVTLTAVGYGTDHSGMGMAGLITGIAGGVGLYAGIQMMRAALPKFSMGPARPYVSPGAVGLAGSF